MEIIKNKAPEFKKVKMKCDKILSKKLIQYPLIRDNMNESKCTCFIGGMGSGKTSLVFNMLGELYSEVFHNVILVMPPNSRNSLGNQDKILNNIEDMYDELNEDVISEIYEKVKEDSLKNKFTLIIYDDVQASLKDPYVVKTLKRLVLNQRHLRCSQWFIQQSWTGLEKTLRSVMNNIIVFKIAKIQQEQLLEDVLELNKKQYQEIQKLVYDEPYQWMFININTKRIYKKFDEIILNR